MTLTADVVVEITTHHAHLQSALSDLVGDVVAAARDGRDHSTATESLLAMLEHDVVPHARAEEDVLYAAAADVGTTRLVTGMIFEHEALLGLVQELRGATTAVDAAAAARALREIFVGHVRRENELLLPALAAAPDVDLVGLLPRMQAKFAEYRTAQA